MIIDPDVFLGAILPNLSKWFNKSDVEYKRKDIANLIKEIASKDKIFPKIKLPSREEAYYSKDKNSAAKSSKKEKLDAKIREESIKSFKSDKLKTFDMFEASFKSSPVKKKPKMISDVQMADKGAREESGNSRADPEFRGGLSLGLAGN